MSAEATAYVWANSPYKANKMLIHLAIADVVNDGYEHRFFMTNKNLAMKCNATRQTVNGAVQEFVADGFLEVIRQYESGVVEYRFLYPVAVEESDTPVKNFDTPVAESDTPPVKESDTPVKNFDTEQETNTTTTTQGELKTTNSSDCDRVWEAYVASWRRVFTRGINPPRFSDKRKKLIAKWLKEYSVEELILAVTGWEHSDWHKGDNPQGKPYHEIERFLKSDEKIEMFTAYHSAKKPVSAGRVNEAHGVKRERSNEGVIELGDDDEEDFIDD